MNILQIYLSDLATINSTILDKVADPTLNMGKKENNYWIIKGNALIQSNDQSEQVAVNTINILLQQAFARSFDNVMIIDR